MKIKNSIVSIFLVISVITGIPSAAMAAETGYTIAMTPNSAEGKTGESLSVELQLSGTGHTSYNSAEIEVSYDSQKLAFSKDGSSIPDNMTVEENEDVIVLRQYGSDRELGCTASLSFVLVAEGEAVISVTNANIDTKDKAMLRNAPPAILSNAQCIIDITAIEKTYPVYVNGSGYGSVTAEDTAIAGKDFTFSVSHDAGYSYGAPEITIDGKSYYDFTVSDSVYTIPSDDITGTIVIKQERTWVQTGNTVAVHLSGNASCYLTASDTATIGDTYSFFFSPDDDRNYSITARSGTKLLNVEKTGRQLYSISNITEEFTITASVFGTNTGNSISCNLYPYVKLDGGKVIYLLTVTGDPGDGKTYTFDGNEMFYHRGYGSYVWLIVSEKTRAELKTELAPKLNAVNGNETIVDASRDIDGSGKEDKTDINLISDIYNARYDGFSEIGMECFLRADLDISYGIDIRDGVAWQYYS